MIEILIENQEKSIKNRVLNQFKTRFLIIRIIGVLRIIRVLEVIRVLGVFRVFRVIRIIRVIRFLRLFRLLRLTSFSRLQTQDSASVIHEFLVVSRETL